MLNRSNLFAYQKRAVDFIKSKGSCALWVDMGLGKTVSALTAFSDMQSTFDAGRLLTVAPLRVARKVWSDEIDEWAHLRHLKVAKICGTPKQRLAALNDKSADIHTINREQVMWLEEQFIHDRKQIRRWAWDTVALDESQSFKSTDAERFRSMRRLRRLASSVIELTGTPMPNGYADLWAQIYLLDGGIRLGRTVTAFRDRWFHPVIMGAGWVNWIIKDGAAAQIKEAIKDIVLVLRAEDYLDLPPIKNNFIRVDLPPKARAQYLAMEKHALLRISEEKAITAVNAGVCMGKLLQMANGAVYDKERLVHHIHDAKLDALEEVLESCPKGLIAYGFIHDKDRIIARLNSIKELKGRWAVLDSAKSERDFQEGKIDYLLLHPASGGHGLNSLYKSGCEDVIWYGLTNNLEFYQQLRDRIAGGIRRIGRNVKIHHIVADETVDIDMIALLDKKDATQEDVKMVLSARAEEVL